MFLHRIYSTSGRAEPLVVLNQMSCWEWMHPDCAIAQIQNWISIGTLCTSQCSHRDGITCPQSQLEARLLFCPVSFGAGQEARPPCLPRTLSPGRLIDRTSV